MNYSRHTRGDFEYIPLDSSNSDNVRRLILGMSVTQPIGGHFVVKLDGFHSQSHSNIETATVSDNQIFKKISNSEQLSGGGTRLHWRQSGNLMVAGVDYQYAQIHANDALLKTDIQNRRADRWGGYINDTHSLGMVSVSIGARYDITGTSGNQFSPSIGLTWHLSDNNLLRGYTAKGYSLPSFYLDRGSEQVWTSQIGLESSTVPYLWLKGTLFRNDTWDISTYDSQSATYRSERQIKQGFEVESRTAEMYNLSLRSGYNYVDAYRPSDGSVVKDIPSQTVHLALQYDDHKRFKGILTGRHIFWNAEEYHNGSYNGMLWDVHLNAKPFSGELRGMELFFSLRNIFNGSQYLDEIYRNNSRWAEGGVRYRF